MLDLGPCTSDILLKLTGREGGYTAVWEIIGQEKNKKTAAKQNSFDIRRGSYSFSS